MGSWLNVTRGEGYEGVYGCGRMGEVAGMKPLLKAVGPAGVVLMVSWRWRYVGDPLDVM
jgi:hypothetical protein